MGFQDWDDVAALELPIHGKTYKIRPMRKSDLLRLEVTAEKIRAALQAGEDIPEDARISDEDSLRMMLGPAFAEMRADNVPDAAIFRAALTARVDAQQGRTMAEHMWEHGPDPEALAAELAALADSITSHSTAAAGSSTKKPASTSGTTSTARKRKATPSRGRKSPTSSTSSRRTSPPSTASD